MISLSMKVLAMVILQLTYDVVGYPTMRQLRKLDGIYLMTGNRFRPFEVIRYIQYKGKYIQSI